MLQTRHSQKIEYNAAPLTVAFMINHFSTVTKQIGGANKFLPEYFSLAQI